MVGQTLPRYYCWYQLVSTDRQDKEVKVQGQAATSNNDNDVRGLECFELRLGLATELVVPQYFACAGMPAVF